MPTSAPMRNRKTLRLPGFDYSLPGIYFITSCTHNREFLFVSEPETLAVTSAWNHLKDVSSGIELDEFVVMPNHVHGILWILEDGAYRLHPGTWKNASDGCRDEQLLIPAPVRKAVTLGNIIGAFKTTAASRINKLHRKPGAIIWQKSFYEHIVRNNRELNSIREYIRENPGRWADDRDNPQHPMFNLPVCSSADYLDDKY
ncbi:MAG: transposase [Chloroflexota bacterium]